MKRWTVENYSFLWEHYSVPSKFTSLFFVQFNSTHLPKFSPLLSLTLFGCSLYLLIAKNCFSIFHAIAFS